MLLEDLGVFLGADLHLVGPGHEGGEAFLARGRIDRTCGQDEQGSDEDKGAEDAFQASHSPKTSICSGWVASMEGPL